MKLRHALILFLLTCASCGAYPSSNIVFVTNERAGTITVIDTTTDKVIDTLSVGGRPRGIRLSSDGSNAYIAISAPFRDQKAVGFDEIRVIHT